MIRIIDFSDDHYLKIGIQNSGCHIDSDSLPRIFDRFYQCDTSHAQVGNGLGLSIIKQILTLHKGTISVQNLDDFGVEFTVTLPKNNI